MDQLSTDSSVTERDMAISHGGNLAETGTEFPLPTPGAPKITFGSALEMYSMVVYQCIVALWCSAAHSLVIFCIWRYSVLQSANNYMKATYSVLDILLSWFCLIIVIASAITNGRPYPEWVCHVVVSSGVAVFFAMIYVVAIMAYERYRFFLHPLTYPNMFSPRRTAIIIGCAVVVPWAYAIFTEIPIGRTYHESSNSCILPGISYLVYVQLCVFFLPGMLLSTYSTIRICRLAVSSQVAPAEMEADAAATVSSTDKIRITAKAILLVSGTFWGTYIPPLIIRAALFSSGYTWYDLDTRRYVLGGVMIRLSELIGRTVSSALNPVIYYHTDKNIRVMIRKTLGLTVAEQDS